METVICWHVAHSIHTAAENNLFLTNQHTNHHISCFFGWETTNTDTSFI